ncbi:MAG TPA: PLP-dependent aminotransferase family protein, partial [Vicinamibacterales bacterium]|nr:PLP-dependent aminotransferase family protein [Vicinamibacterales bacterium]
VTAAFELLQDQKLIRAEVGRGTFVAASAAADPPTPPAARSARSEVAPWRRRSLMTLGARLRARYPDAVDCSTGRPDVTLLPMQVLQRSWTTALQGSTAADLQYAGPDVLNALVQPLAALLERDGIDVTPEHLLIGSSAQQWMMLALEVSSELRGVERPRVAIEEPGYPTIMDAYERAGAALIPVAVDEEGALPDSLDRACAAGAAMALLTPRAQNPTGATWSRQRRNALGAVLAAHPRVIAVEDDPFADVASTSPGSLLSEANIADRVIYIRSFAKSIAPDLRIAAAAARPRLRALLAEAKSFSDGWTSRLLQRTLAIALKDDEIGELLTAARDAYRERRARAAEAINLALRPHGAGTWCGPDGVNLWVHLPAGCDANDVVERAAAGGVRVAPGEPFFIRPGRGNVVRLNAGSVAAEHAFEAGRIVGDAAVASRSKGHGLIHV